VTIGRVWIGDSIYWPLTHSRLVTAIYRSLTHTDLCPQSITVSTSRFLATDFNKGTITLSLQISHIKSSLHSPTFNWALLQLNLFFTASRVEPPHYSKSNSHCDWRSVSQSDHWRSRCKGRISGPPLLQSVLVSSPVTRYLLLFDSYGLVSVGRPLWREDGSVFHQNYSLQ
jgi:hypothetical protein